MQCEEQVSSEDAGTPQEWSQGIDGLYQYANCGAEMQLLSGLLGQSEEAHFFGEQM